MVTYRCVDGLGLVSTAGRDDAHSVRSNVCWLLGGHSLPVFLTDGRVDAHLSILMVLLGDVPPCPSPDLTEGGCPSLEGIGLMQPSGSSFDVLGCCLERLTTSAAESSPYISLYVSKLSDITFRDFASLFHLFFHTSYPSGVISGTSVTSGYMEQLPCPAIFEAAATWLDRASWQNLEQV
jgi:hypothetical protein